MRGICYFCPISGEYSNKTAERVKVPMLRIVLCEENTVEQARWNQMLRYVLFDREDYEVRFFQSSRELLTAAEQEPDFGADLIFMDIQMPDQDRTHLEKLVREKQMEAALIFVTAQSEYVFLGYEIHAYDYLLKPLTPEKLERTLDRYLTERQSDSRQYLFVNKRPGGVRIPLKQVSYFVSDKRKIRAVFDSSQEPVEFYMKMGELEERLKNCEFLRCHQSFLLNINKIRSWDGSGISISGQEKIPVSRQYRKEIREMMERYKTL